jgi:hypothetical protein
MDRSPLTGFIALLRSAGLCPGTERVLLAHRAVALSGLHPRVVLQAALLSTLCASPDELPLFDAAFALYWRDPGARLQDLLPQLPPAALLRPRKPPAGGPPRRLLEAIAPAHAWRPAGEPQALQLGASAVDDAQRHTLEDAATAELLQARALAQRIRAQLPLPPASRRWRASAQGALHLGAALRRLQAGRPLLPLPRRSLRPPAQTVLVLLDASGSMQEELRSALLAAHALAQQRGGAQSWEFWAFAGTRLQALTPLLRREPDADAALRALTDAGLQQGGGTRMADALRALRARQGGRIAAGRCTLLLLSDGLDHQPDDPALTLQLAAWKRSGVQLLWLDPLRRQHLGASAALAAGVDRRL